MWQRYYKFSVYQNANPLQKGYFVVSLQKLLDVEAVFEQS